MEVDCSALAQLSALGYDQDNAASHTIVSPSVSELGSVVVVRLDSCDRAESKQQRQTAEVDLAGRCVCSQIVETKGTTPVDEMLRSALRRASP